MQVNRWYYLKDPVFPELDNAGKRFHYRSLYSEVTRVLKEARPEGLTGREVAQNLGKAPHNVVPLLWNLKKYAGAVESRKEGFHRTPGLAEFAELPQVARMLSKLGSKKTRAPWLRRLYRYQCWLSEKGYFSSVVDLLEDYRRAETDEGKYRHLDLIQEFLNSWKASLNTKNSIAKVIRGFYRKNRFELPREKLTLSREMLKNAPAYSSAEEYVKPHEVWRMINDGAVPVRDKAVMAIILCMGLDESTFSQHFNLFAYSQITHALGERLEDWDLTKAPVRINLTRPKTGVKFYGFLPGRVLELIREWLNVRRGLAGVEIRTWRDAESGLDTSDPIFVTFYKKALDEQMIGRLVRQSSFKSGVQRRSAAPIESSSARYRIHAHEFRDTFKTTCKIAGVDGAVSEFFIGHSTDKLGYDKSPWAYPDHFRKQYLLLEPYILGEEQRLELQEERRRELEQRIVSLESSLSLLTSQLAAQVSLQHQNRSAGSVSREQAATLTPFAQATPAALNSSGAGRVAKTNRKRKTNKVVDPSEIDGFMDEGWEPVLTLSDGRVIIRPPAVEEEQLEVEEPAVVAGSLA